MNKDEASRSMLFTYCTTPNPKTGKSPIEILHGRQPKTLLAFLQPSPATSLEWKDEAHKILIRKYHSNKILQQIKTLSTR
jgi:hypothetical protein